MRVGERNKERKKGLRVDELESKPAEPGRHLSDDSCSALRNLQVGAYSFSPTFALEHFWPWRQEGATPCYRWLSAYGCQDTGEPYTTFG